MTWVSWLILVAYASFGAWGFRALLFKSSEQSAKDLAEAYAARCKRRMEILHPYIESNHD